MKMISSTALPNVTLSSAPIVSPSLIATLSVANDNKEASGMMAIALIANTTVGLTGAASPLALTRAPRTMPTGTKTNRTLIQEAKAICLTSFLKRIASGSFVSFSSSPMVAGSSPSPFLSTTPRSCCWVSCPPDFSSVVPRPDEPGAAWDTLCWGRTLSEVDPGFDLPDLNMFSRERAEILAHE